jgi:DNA-directed RNA polymerase alpha subunit
MALKVCEIGHRFEKTSDCPVCPECSSAEMQNKFGEEFPSLGAPAFRALDNFGITSLKDLTRYTEQDLLTLHGFGPKAVRLLKEALEEKGMSFLGKVR